QSNGGIVSARAASSEPVRTILSGPAGGILGAEYLARLAGYDRIVSFDRGGALRVGPESAGADPGPAAYGKGVQPTVTDAHLVLGRLGGAGLLGGEFHLDADLARYAIDPPRKKAPSLKSAEEFA